MAPASPDPESSQSSSGYEDGLGRRVLAFDRETGDMLERLVLRPELSAFEPALRERMAIVAGIDDERFLRPRGIERGADDRLTIVSEYVAGRRLADVLDAAAEHGIVAGLDAALGLLLELLPALARLHDAGLAHGTVAPGRMLMTPAGQLVLLDSIYAEPLERLKLTRKRLWAELRLAFPAAAGIARFNTSADLGHATMVAAALTVGRPLREDDYPDGIPALRREIVEIASIRGSKAFADALDKFLGATLPLAGRRVATTASADEAAIDLRKLVRKELGINTCRTAMLEFFQQVDAADAERLAAEAAVPLEARPAAARIETQVTAAPRIENDRADAERHAHDRAETERLTAERNAAGRADAERQQQAARALADTARVEAARQEEAAARERAEHARLEAERAEGARVAREREEAARLEHERAEQARLEAARREQERAEQARLEAARLEAARLEQERLERARLEAERLERERAEAARLEAERLERERAEAARLEAERLERARIEAERLERERLEKARLEAQRLERERAEQARLEAERLEAERLEKERLEAERAAKAEQARLEAERLERERQEKARLEAERLERERQEKARLEAERLERERVELARLDAERRAREEKARLEAERREREEQARLEAERLEKERQEKARVEAERQERERAEKARLEAERLEKERLEAERRERAEKARLEAERQERERAEKARIEVDRQERQRVEKARLDAERLERERLETERRERVARERAEKARLELERAEKARLEAERLESERVAAERRERELLEAARAERERAEKARLEAVRLENERVEHARLEAEREEQEEERERAERARIEAERARVEAERLAAELDRHVPAPPPQREPARPVAAQPPPARVPAPEPAFVRAAAGSSWLIPPDRAVKFDQVAPQAPPPAPSARAYPIYVPPAEPSSWTADVAAVSSPRDLDAFASTPGFGGTAASSSAPIRLKEDVDFGPPSRATGRTEPEHLSAAEAYAPFASAEPPRQIPWKLIAASVFLVAGTIAIIKGYTPSTAPIVNTLGQVAPAARAAAAAAAAPRATPPPVGGTRLTVTTQPAGARVTIDGKPMGETPIDVDTITPGRHVVIVTAASGASAKRTVRVEAGKILTLDLQLFSGFAAISAPFVIEVSENGKSLGTSEEQILLSPGSHNLRLANKDLGYVATEAIDIQPGEVTRLSLDPRGRANINAAPWAEVYIDGEKAGETPLANVAIRLGIREIVFKNPQFGERKVTATITGTAAATISVDFNK